MRSFRVLGQANGRYSRGRQLKFAFGGVLIFMGIVFAFMQIATVRTETGPELLGPENWPVTVEETVHDLLPRLSLLEKLRFMLVKKEDLTSLHLGFGTWVHNRYGLWRGNDKLILSACGFGCHPEDASMKIIEAVWQAEHR